MTAQEAISRIQDHNEVHSRAEKHFAIRITEALNMAVEALKKQIPKKTIRRQPVGNGTVVYGYCPICGDATSNFRAFCSECGQALDWSDME